MIFMGNRYWLFIGKMRVVAVAFTLRDEGGSRQNAFGEWVLASDKPENLVLGAVAKDDGTRTWLPARDESPPLRAADAFRLSLCPGNTS